jgi:hypothetical protein
MSDNGLLEYISFRQSTHLNYHRAADIGMQDYGKLIPQAMKFVQQDLPTSILHTRDDNNSLLELGIRCLLFVVTEENCSRLLIGNWLDNGQDTAHLRINLTHLRSGQSSHPSGVTFRSP